MALNKRGHVWHIDIIAPDGQRIRKSTGTSDQRAASEYHDRIKAELWRASRLGDKPEKSWREAVVRFLQETQHKASHGDDISRLRWLDQHLGHKKLSDISTSLIARIGSEKRSQTSPATANRHLAVISVILRKAAREWEWLEASPAVKMFPEEKRRIRWLTKPEVLILLRELPDHLEAMARFTLATGLRMRNVTGLKWSQLDMERQLAWIHPDQFKTRKAIAVPLNEDALAIVRNQIGKHQQYVFTYKGEPVKKANTWAWKKALKRAGISDFRWHDLRHTWASWHVQAGTPIHALQELGGWEDVNMVRRYAHLGGQHLAEHAAKISLNHDTKTSQTVVRLVEG